MASSIMDSILGMVTPEMKQALATRFGESSQGVQSGLGAATAATLDGLASKSSDSGFLSQVLGMLGGGMGQNLLSSLSSIASGGPTGATADLVNRFLPMVFGSQQGQAANAISQQFGLSASSGTGLLKMAAPLVLAYFGKLQNAGTLNASSLGDMLRTEAPNLRSYLPTGLLGSAAGVASATVNRATTAVTSARTAASAPPRWLVPAAIAGALILAWLVIRSMSPPRPVPTAASVTSEAVNSATSAASSAANAAGDAATKAWAALGDMMKVKLPDGSEINVPSRGVEARLVSYLNDRSAAVSDNTWFDFDRLLFDTGKATLQPASQEQLTNIADILKAYPQVKIRIGGYTDNTGDPAANLQLSEQRADNVMAELVNQGIDPSRMTAQGYGAENPIADNSTEEGRQKNRRISLRVTDKQPPSA
ncbi:MAG TPA: OmpA family protein [Steroidobacteraceae bacterium]|nr:OmpA family protein [Steroidobacteraceae bacterium]